MLNRGGRYFNQIGRVAPVGIHTNGDPSFFVKGTKGSFKGTKSLTHIGEEDYTAKKGLIHDEGGHRDLLEPLDYS
tara:strand:- start:2867 stop:3091 length:225 start_codon:yes stop_codon:yes gene_type:complete